MRRQIALDQMIAADRDILGTRTLSVRAKGRSARAKERAELGEKGALRGGRGEIVGESGWIWLRSKTERRVVIAETCRC